MTDDDRGVAEALAAAYTPSGRPIWDALQADPAFRVICLRQEREAKLPPPPRPIAREYHAAANERLREGMRAWDRKMGVDPEPEPEPLVQGAEPSSIGHASVFAAMVPKHLHDDVHAASDALYEQDEWDGPDAIRGITGKFHGADATDTERASGIAKEIEDSGPLKPGSAAHSVLRVYGDGQRRSSYQASKDACGDFHARRRESTRLLDRGYLAKSGTLPNPAPGGRDHVDAYTITESGRAELARLGVYLPQRRA